ncbi:uncharacterized protein LOC132042637 isoform X3 [Lycium ferocissimum]|uniref:uncharacterized protein LOC132042637 isoform X3 n=1 Tax=Lycium ferocissimum TaxID=112874 RepID=UPI002815A05E|nr:uncharacterized protein LOC132042637 isoform X3 [Lycium ferocissimum]
MRIRKHAKISPLHYASSIFLKQHGTVLQTHVNCQLNQSPWDVITFSLDENINQQTLLVPHQLDGYDNYAVNGTFYDSEQSITSMKLDDNTEMKEMNYFNSNNVADVPADIDDFKKEQDEEMGELGLEKNEDNNNVTTMCCKNDGKGWQCSREAKKGHTLCEHHLAQVKKNYSSSNSAHSTITTANNSDAKINSTPSSRGRPHRPKKSSSSEFYYYSGFGPLWGKKRGPSTGKNINAGEIYSNDSYGAQSSSSQMDNESNFDYIEDEDDDDDEVENCQTKRARKPIKARSLKSLM